MSFHRFSSSLDQGEVGAKDLDVFFEREGWEISPVTLDEDKLGFDRWFVKDGLRKAVEYKTDTKAADTGNVFVETISVDKPMPFAYGWAFTSKADEIVYYIRPLKVAYIAIPSDIRSAIPDWLRKFRTRYANNVSYHTHGIPVPIEDYAKICIAEVRITLG